MKWYGKFTKKDKKEQKSEKYVIIFKKEKEQMMKTSQILVATTVAGLMLSGCVQLKLPELPKIQKQENKKLTDEECKMVLKKYRDTEPGTSEAYIKLKYDAYECNTRSNGADIDIDKIMEINK